MRASLLQTAPQALEISARATAPNRRLSDCPSALALCAVSCNRHLRAVGSYGARIVAALVAEFVVSRVCTYRDADLRLPSCKHSV
jgi:hypothetical protein